MNQLQASALVGRAHPVPQARTAVPFHASVTRVVPTLEPFAYTAHTDAPLKLGGVPIRFPAARIIGAAFEANRGNNGAPRGLVLIFGNKTRKRPAPGPLKNSRSQLGVLISSGLVPWHMPLKNRYEPTTDYSPCTASPLPSCGK